MQPDGEYLQFIVSVLASAGSPSNEIQQQLMKAVDEMSKRSDFGLTLAYILSTANIAPLDIRQRAGLLLKSSLGRGAVSPSQSGLRELVLVALVDQQSVVRKTAGSIITTLVTASPESACSDVLQVLLEMLTNEQPQISESGLSAITKISEDLIDMWRQSAIPGEAGSGPSGEAAKVVTDFIAFSKAQLVPFIFRLANPKRIDLLNLFALNFLFFPNQPLSEYLGSYFECVGQMAATETHPDIMVSVCKGLVYISQHHPDMIGPSGINGVFRFILSASRHKDNPVRLEALKFWSVACLNSEWNAQLQTALPELLPILLENMVYTQDDYLAMDEAVLLDDNASVPDRPEEMAPRFHKDKADTDDASAGADADEDQDDLSGGSTWGNEWTVRKAAASALDHMATAFRDAILPHILPLIEKMLSSDNWEVQESSVLALGAIGHGCMQGLSPHLPAVLNMLVTISSSPKPLLRSISCWTISRFAAWIAFDTHRNTALPLALGVILNRMLDHNKRVQEAAVSAFVNIEEEAGAYLEDHLDSIMKTTSAAMQYYQSKNLLILLDAIACLFEAVGKETMSKPEVSEILVPPIVAAFQRVNPVCEKQLAVSLFECLTAICASIGPSIGIDALAVTVSKCARILEENVEAFGIVNQDSSTMPKPDADILACALDLLCGVIDGMADAAINIVRNINFVPVLIKLISQFDPHHPTPTIRNYYSNTVKQCAFALLGDCSRTCIVLLTDELVTPVIPVMALYIGVGPMLVSNNSSWCMGELVMRKNLQFIGPFLEQVALALLSNLKRVDHISRPIVRQNAAIALGRLASVAGDQLIALGIFRDMFYPWCEAMKRMRNDDEKISSVKGFISCVKASPQTAVSTDNLRALHELVASMFPPPSMLEADLRSVMVGYRQLLGDQAWAAMWSSLPVEIQYRINHMYSLGVPVTQPPPPPR